MCRSAGIRRKATIVDHVKPHRGDRRLFFCFENTQSLCKPHHDSEKQQAEVLGYSTEIGADGLPVDPRDPFLRGNP